MQGLPDKILPVFICSIAEPWMGESAVIECKKARSSIQVARCGNRSLTHLPHWPYCLNFHFGPTTRPSFFLPLRPNVLTGTVLPSSSYSLGLYSNVSTWLGPPYMNRKMTLLAFGAKCGFFGASGLTGLGFPSPAVAWLK